MSKLLKENAEKIHGTCKHCVIVTDRFLDYKREPLMGRCEFFSHLFLLSEKTKCNHHVNK